MRKSKTDQVLPGDATSASSHRTVARDARPDTDNPVNWRTQALRPTQRSAVTPTCARDACTSRHPHTRLQRLRRTRVRVCPQTTRREVHARKDLEPSPPPNIRELLYKLLDNSMIKQVKQNILRIRKPQHGKTWKAWLRGVNHSPPSIRKEEKI